MDIQNPNEKKKILVIDDDSAVRELFKVALEREGYVVLLAAEGIEGITKATSEKPDAIVLDLMLPNKGGYQILKELSANMDTASIPVMLVTAKYLDNESYEMIKSKSNVKAFHMKPTNPSVFVMDIKKILRGEKVE